MAGWDVLLMLFGWDVVASKRKTLDQEQAWLAINRAFGAGAADAAAEAVSSAAEAAPCAADERHQSCYASAAASEALQLR